MALKEAKEATLKTEALDPHKAPSLKFQQKLHLMIYLSDYFDISLQEACRLLEEHEVMAFGSILTDEQS